MISDAHHPHGGPRSLLLLNHRGDSVVELRSWFQERGWEVHTARDLESSLELLRNQQAHAVLVLPLTLRPDTLEWQCLTEQLSPERPLPWLVLPWAGAPAASVAALLRDRDGLADWVVDPGELSEIDARLQNLMRLGRLLDQSRHRAEALEGQLVTDHKTGLYNDRFFRQRLREEFDRTLRHGNCLSLLLLDLDDFKKVNDATSYEFGDLVLRTMGEVLRRGTRSIDVPARIGGDEFAVLLPNTRLDEAVAVARRIAQLARRTRLDAPPDSGLERVDLRSSVGLATFDGHTLGDPRALFLRANEQLKVAKKAGKDQISFYDPRAQEAEGEAEAGGD